MTWSEAGTSATPEFSRTGGGAAFITSEDVEDVDTRNWREQKKAAFDRDKGYKPGHQWE
jgi:hypothetical protein